MTDFDPNAPLLDEKGLEYENFADFLRGKPVDCARNFAAGRVYEHASSDHRARIIHSLYTGFNRCLNPRAFSPDAARSLGDTLGYVQGLERFTPKPPSAGGEEGNGQPGAVQAPADLVHPASEPPVHGRMGP